jgi:hypothetical protein
MTVSTLINRVDYTGNGSTTVYAVPFPFFAESDLDVYVDGVLKTLVTHYTVAITLDVNGAFSSADVTFLTAPPNTEAVAIVRDLPLTQTVSTTSNSQLLPSIVEKALDRVTLVNQDTLARLSRVVQLDASAPSSVEITPEDGKYLAWDGVALVNKSAAEVAIDAGSELASQVATNTSSISTLNVVQNPTLVGNALKFSQVNADESAYVAVDLPLPNGYIDAPIPTFDTASPKRVNFNGTLTARSRDNTANIVLSSASRNLDLATNGANGLADGLTVANDTWYGVYASSVGLVASTTLGATSLTIGGTSRKVVQLPLMLRTNSSANIINFIVSEWNMRSSKINYHKAWKRGITGLGEPSWNSSIQTGQTDNRVASNVNIYNATITNYTTFDLSSLVPVGAVTADIYVYVVSAGGGGNIWFAMRGVTSQTGIDAQRYTASSTARALDQSLELPIDSNRQFQAVTDVTNMNIDVSVTGYQFQV